MSLSASFSQYQGVELTPELMREILGKQKKLIDTALGDGLKRYHEVLTGSAKPAFSLNLFLVFFNRYRELVLDISWCLASPEKFTDAQIAIYVTLHRDSIELPMQLFGEFLLGLVRFEVAAQLQLRVLAELGFDPAPAYTLLSGVDRNDFFAHLNALGSVQTMVKSFVAEKYIATDSIGKYWSDISKCYQANPDFLRLSRCLLGLHTLPKNPELVTLAQVLHWSGWGGDGSSLRPHFAHLIPNLLQHCHGYLSDEYDTRFSHLFAKMTPPLASLATSTLNAVQVLFPEKGRLKIADFGSGPHSTLVAAGLEELRAAGIDTELHVYDICSFRPDKTDDGKTVHYMDLNLPAAEAITHKYDVVGIGYVMHQLVDPARSLRDLMSCLNDGGVAVTLQIKQATYLQAASLPINLVDREGSVPDFSPRELSVSSNEPDEVTFLYPISELAQELPDGSTEVTGDAMWASRIYFKATLPRAEYEMLLDHYDRAEYSGCMRILTCHGYRLQDMLASMGYEVDAVPRPRL